MICQHCGQDAGVEGEDYVGLDVALYLVNLHRELVGLPLVTRADFRFVTDAVRQAPAPRPLSPSPGSPP